MDKETVVVLLSTYNGEKYLKEQIDSVLAQEGVNVHLVIRDDGSKDATTEILKRYVTEYSNIELLIEDNCGAEGSFNKLCLYARENIQGNYYAFCDQDDVWESQKLFLAVEALKSCPQQLPNLYFSNLKMVDANLKYMRDMFAEGEVDVSKRMALLQIFTYGCTCVFNRQALTDYCLSVFDNFYHDCWMFIICAFLGNVYYDKNGYILYRQHSDNLSGEKGKGIRLFVLRIKALIEGKVKPGFEPAAKALICNFSNRLSDNDITYISMIAYYRKSIKNKLKLLLSKNYRTGHWTKDVLIKIRILINYL